MNNDSSSEPIDDRLVSALCRDYQSRRGQVDSISLEDAARRCPNRADRVALIANLLPDEITSFRAAHHRDPSCHELCLLYATISGELQTAYEHLEADYWYPSRIHRYRVVRILSSSSAQAVVVQAEDDALKRTLAIKYSRRSSDRMSLRREGDLLQKLRLNPRTPHPHIVNCLDIAEGDQTALILDFLPGATLTKAFAGSARADLSKSLHIAGAIADALAHCHSKRIYHNDISPNNIFVTDNDSAVLIDFALAVEQVGGVDVKLGMPDLGGTPDFFPPERLAGSVRRGETADIYSLAAVLYWMLTGVSPARAAGAADRLPPFEDVPRSIRPVLARALAPRPEDRYQDAGDFRDALRRLQPGAGRLRKYLAVSALALAVAALPFVVRQNPPSAAAPLDEPVLNLLRTPLIASTLLDSSLTSAMLSVDLPSMRTIADQGLPAESIARVLQSHAPSVEGTVGEAFLRKSKDSEEAAQWLSERIRQGLDPDLLLSHQNRERTLLNAALWADNKPAVCALLDAGACPHPYQTLIGSEGSGNLFLFPLARLDSVGQFDLAEQREIALRMLRNGGVVAEPLFEKWRTLLPYTPDEEIYSDIVAAKKVLYLMSENWGLESEPTPNLYERPSSPIAERATKKGPHDWNRFLKEMPKVYYSVLSQNSRPRAGAIQHLISILGDRIFFLGYCEQASIARYSVYETDPKGIDWILYVQKGPMFPMHGSFGEIRPRPTDRSPENAYNRDYFVGFRLTYDAKKQEFSHGGSVYKTLRTQGDLRKWDATDK